MSEYVIGAVENTPFLVKKLLDPSSEFLVLGPSLRRDRSGKIRFFLPILLRYSMSFGELS